MLQGNYLGHWLLAHSILEHQLTAAQRSQQQHSLRLVFLSSCTHSGAKLDFADLGGLRHRYTDLHGLQGYCNTKLCSILAAREFQRRFDRCCCNALRGLQASQAVPSPSCRRLA